MPQILINNLHLGGISDSKYSGMPNSAYKIEGFNLHEEPGIMKVQQAVRDDRESGDTITQKITALVPLNDGKSYLFGAGGRIWSRDSSAVYTEEVSDVAPSQGDSRILDAVEYGDSIYYSMPQRLGRWTIGTAWNTRDDDFSDLLFDDEFHPLKVIENNLYVGNKNVIGEVQTDGSVVNLDAAAAADQGSGIVRIPSTNHGFEVGDSIVMAGTSNYDDTFPIVAVSDVDHFDIDRGFFTAETFETNDTATLVIKVGFILEDKYTIQSFGTLITHLIVGTITEGTSAGSFSGFSHVFNWDLKSIDPISDVLIKEFGINAFMEFGGSLLIQAGKKGNWYSYNGQSARNFRRFPADWSEQKTGKTEANAISSWNGIPIFGFSNVNDNPALQGVYSLGGYDSKYPNVFNFEFPATVGGSDDTEVGVVTRIGEDLVFGRNTKLMRVDLDNKYDGANIETQVINVARDKLKNFKVKINYRSLPAGSSITLQQQTNAKSGISYSAVETTNYSNRKYLESDINIINATTIQFRIFTTRGTDTNTAPEIESIIIDFNLEK